MNLDFLSKPAVLAIVVVTFVATALYVVVDSPEPVAAENHKAVATQPMGRNVTDKKAGSVNSLLGGLEAKLAENPDDAKGWLLLAKSHDHLGNQDAAWAAYARAKELGISDDAFEIKLAAHVSEQLPQN